MEKSWNIFTVSKKLEDVIKYFHGVQDVKKCHGVIHSVQECRKMLCSISMMSKSVENLMECLLSIQECEK